MAGQVRVLQIDSQQDRAKLVGEQLATVDAECDVVSVPTVGRATEEFETGSFDYVLVADGETADDQFDRLIRQLERRPGVCLVQYTWDGSTTDRSLSNEIRNRVQVVDDGETDREVAIHVAHAVETRRLRQRVGRHERVATLLRAVQSRLVRATTLEEIDAAVCETLVEYDPYVFAWIGEYHEDSEVVPRESAGRGEQYLDDIEITVEDDATGQGPTGRAVRTRSLQVTQNVTSDPTYEPWREQASERGYQSSAAIPLEHGDTFYGVLNVYADRRNAFDADERTFLEEFAEVVAHACHRIQVQEQYTTQYRELFEEAPVMIAYTRNDTGELVVEDCNQRFAEKLGYAPETIRGRPLSELYTDESAAKLHESGYERALTGEFETDRREFVTSDGDVLTALLYAGPRRNADGDTVGTLALYVDVTDRERTRELERYQTFLEHSTAVIAVLDDEGRFEYQSPAVERLLGYQPDTLVGENAFDLVHPDDKDGVLAEFTAGIEEPGTEHTVEYRFEDADGDWRWLRSTAVNYLDDPAVEGVVVNSVDITERKQHEETLQQARDELRQIVDLVPDMIFAKNRDGEYILVNETTAEYYGLPADEIRGRTDHELLPSEQQARQFRDDDLDVIDSGESKHVPEEELTTADGETRILQTTKIPYEIAGTDEDAVLGYARDVTELKEYERRLERQRDNLEVLNQVVRHDIRNELQLVLTYAEILDGSLEGTDREHVERILSSARSAVDITESARDVAEITLQSEADRKPVNFRYVLENEIAAIRGTYEHALVTISGTIPRIEVLADDMLDSVFRNLLTNAIEHNDKEIPNVTVSATETGGEVELRVADNGPGIPDDRKAEIFEEGKKGLDSTGTGLGLYLVHTLVDRYDGEIWIEDGSEECNEGEAIGEGSGDTSGAVFVVRLPAV